MVDYRHSPRCGSGSGDNTCGRGGRTRDQDRALITLVPHTTSMRKSSYEAVVAVPFLKSGAFDAQGLVTVPPVRLIRRLGRLNVGQLAQVEVAVCSWLGLPLPSEG